MSTSNDSKPTTGFAVALIAVSVLAGASGYGLYHLTREQASPVIAISGSKLPAVDQQLIGQRRPAFELPDLDGEARSIDEWDGKILLVNFWATWCPPCRKEMPDFVDMQAQYGEQGLQIVGVAIDERDAVQDFADSLGVNYPILVGAIDASEIAKRYGNRFGALPYSVMIDRKGKIRFIQPGELTRETFEAELKALL